MKDDKSFEQSQSSLKGSLTALIATDLSSDLEHRVDDLQDPADAHEVEGNLRPENKASDQSEELDTGTDIDLTPATLFNKYGTGDNSEEQQHSKLKSKAITAYPLRGQETAHLCDVDFKWLKGSANERAIFWFWVYIKNASLKDLMLPVFPERKDEKMWDDRIYKHFNLPEFTSSTDERSRLIVTFFNKLSSCYPPQTVKASFEHVRDIWSRLISLVSQVRWIKKKDENALEWAKNYLLKRQEIKNNILEWFRGTDMDELRISIMGAIDCWIIRGDEIDALDKKRILDDMYRAFQQRARRKKSNVFVLNVEISLESQRQLIELIELNDIKRNKFIEVLIGDEYKLFISNPESYQSISLRKDNKIKKI